MKSIQFHRISEYHGPNPRASGPVVVVRITGTPPLQLADLIRAEQTLSNCVQLTNTPDSTNAPDVADDAALLSVHMAVRWTLAILNEVRGFLHDAGAARENGHLIAWLAFHDPTLTQNTLQWVLRLVLDCAQGHTRETDNIRRELQTIWHACRQQHPDYQARILMRGSRALGRPYLPAIPNSRYWQFGWGHKGRTFFESASNGDGALGTHWAAHKPLSKTCMNALGLPTPRHVLVQHAEELLQAAQHIAFPCVVKPIDRGGGKGVTADIRNMDDLRSAWELARQYTSGPVMVERHVEGDDHRIVVLHGKVIAVIRRQAASVMGDGQTSVQGLLDALNAHRSRNLVNSRYRRPVPSDPVLMQHLSTQHLTLSDIPARGQRVTLRSNANLSTGGVCTDVTALCHPELIRMSEMLVRAFGLSAAGIDYLTPDIGQPTGPSTGAFIELNATPALDVCVAAGWTEESIAHHLLGTGDDRIPVSLTILSQESLAQRTSRVIESARTGNTEGEALVIGDTVTLDGVHLTASLHEPWAAVRLALRNPHVKRLTIVCSVDEILMNGLPIDQPMQSEVESIDGSPVLPAPWLQLLERH